MEDRESPRASWAQSSPGTLRSLVAQPAASSSFWGDLVVLSSGYRDSGFVCRGWPCRVKIGMKEHQRRKKLNCG